MESKLSGFYRSILSHRDDPTPQSISVRGYDSAAELAKFLRVHGFGVSAFALYPTRQFVTLYYKVDAPKQSITQDFLKHSEFVFFSLSMNPSTSQRLPLYKDHDQEQLLGYYLYTVLRGVGSLFFYFTSSVDSLSTPP